MFYVKLYVHSLVDKLKWFYENARCYTKIYTSIKTCGKPTKNVTIIPFFSVPVVFTFSFNVQFWMFCLVLGAGWNHAVVLASILFSNMERNCEDGGNYIARGIPRCLLLYSSHDSPCMSTSPKRMFLTKVTLCYHCLCSCKQSDWRTWWGIQRSTLGGEM